MALQFHEYFARIPVPGVLKRKVINTETETIDFIENLSKINVFVGPNNSGKSYLLREILKTYLPAQLFAAKIISNLNDNISEVSKNFEYCRALEIRFTADAIPTVMVGNNEKDVDQIDLVFGSLKNGEDISTRIRYIDSITPKTNNPPDQEQIAAIEKFQLTKQEKVELLAHYVYDYSNQKYAKIYIHNHRSILNHKMIAKESKIDVETLDSAFLLDLRTQYFKKDKSARFDYSWESNDERFFKEPHVLLLKDDAYCNTLHIETGIKIYEDILHLALNKRRTLTQYEEFLSKEFFDSKLVTIFPTNEGDNKLKIQIGEEEPYPIYKLGTGLQMIITLTFPLFKYERGIMVVEEPELFVHPGLQKQLMKIYATHERAKDFMFFIATHSNHILDTTLYDNQISIFSVKKSLEESTSDPKFILQNLAHGDDNALTQLGVSNSSVFLANCTIWVEGVTDRMYIQKFMEVFAEKNEPFKRFKEGVHYSFVYSGGSNIDHYDFDQEGSFLKDRESPAVKYFCGKAFVVVDKDNTEDEKQAWKQKRNEKLKEILGENQFEQLEVREIENLLSLKTVCNTVRSYPTWAKTKELTKEQLENNQEAFKNSKIGEFIDEILFPLLKTNETDKRAKHFKAESGTINDKTEFASKAIQHIDKSSMTTEAEELVAKIYAFIESQNKF